MPDVPSTFTEMVVREIYEERFLKKPYDHVPKDEDDFNPRIIVTNMLDRSMFGKAPDPEEIENLIAQKEIDLERLLANMAKRQERA